uniref:Uncharacterized protein n=1 Tax=Triticum urartu TaxID=4572 RepID=A0A8R7U167_TRIUA
MSRFWTCSIQMQQIYKALLCVQDNPNDCPFISSVVYILENGSAKLHVPNQPIAEAKPDVTPLFCNVQVKLLMVHSWQAVKSSNHWCSAK